MFYRLLVLLALLTPSSFSRAEFVVTYFLGENNFDSYSYELIKMSLEKTRDKYGDFTLTTVGNIPNKRRFAILQQNTLSNLVVMRGYETKFHAEGELTFINFPIDFGLLGWRICFVSPQSKEKKLKQLNHWMSCAVILLFRVWIGQIILFCVKMAFAL